MNDATLARPERWWACYSFRQKAFHVETESEGLSNNLHALEFNRPVDFVPVGVFQNQKAAHAFLRTIEARTPHRQQVGGGKWN